MVCLGKNCFHLIYCFLCSKALCTINTLFVLISDYKIVHNLKCSTYLGTNFVVNVKDFWVLNYFFEEVETGYLSLDLNALQQPPLTVL